MRRLGLGSFVCLLAVALGAARQQSANFRAEVNLITATAVVRSSDGSLLRDLNKDDFEIFEDGVPQKVQFFARERDIPLSLALVVDASGSQDKFVARHNKDVEKFLAATLAPSDRAVAVCFGNHLRLVSDGTSSVEQIADGLAQFAKGERHFPEIGPKEERDLGTALYDALYFVIEEKLAPAPEERRKAVVLFSDGEENSSEHDLLDAIEMAENSDTLVYAIRYTNAKRHRGGGEDRGDDLNARNKYGVRVMKHLATLTGGADFDGLEGNLDRVFSEIGAELHSLYSIGYVSADPKHDGSFRKLKIVCKRANSVVRVKSGYFAH